MAVKLNKQNLANLGKYRPDIDGLRAISVLAVILYHYDVFPSFTKSGFIGVDVFFVISGFLITNILLLNLDSRYWIRSFYIRRIRRIFPALLIVLISTILFASALLLQYEFRIFGKELLAGSTFSSNIFYFHQSGYFDSSSNQKPLLHLWSLGIEEQFYIFWPILIWLIFRIRLKLIPTLSIITFCSFVYSMWTSKVSQDLSFYSPASRAWELGVGGLVASMNLLKSRKNFPFLGNVGILILFISFAGIDNQRFWPGLSTLLPVLGTALIVGSDNQGSLSNRILENPALVYIGKISFPLYLWHWPLYIFLKMYKGNLLERNEKVLLFILSFLLSILTYKYLELPVRYRVSGVLRTRGLIIAMIILAITGASLSNSNGFPQRLKNHMSFETSHQVSLQLSPPKFQDRNCLAKFPNQRSSEYSWWFCRMSSTKNPTVLLWGNSFANQYFEGLAKNSFFRNQTFLSIGDCSIQRERGLEAGNPCAGDLWAEQQNFVKEIIRSTPTISTVILAGLKEEANSPELADLESALTFLEGLNKRIIVFYPHLKPKRPIFSCIDRPVLKASWDCIVSSSFRRNMEYDFASSLKLIRNRFPSTLIFDPNEAFCDIQKCTFMRDGIPILRDTAPHMSLEGSRLVARNFENWAKFNSVFAQIKNT